MLPYLSYCISFNSTSQHHITTVKINANRIFSRVVVKPYHPLGNNICCPCQPNVVPFIPSLLCCNGHICMWGLLWFLICVPNWLYLCCPQFVIYLCCPWCSPWYVLSPFVVDLSTRSRCSAQYVLSHICHMCGFLCSPRCSPQYVLLPICHIHVVPDVVSDVCCPGFIEPMLSLICHIHVVPDTVPIMCCPQFVLSVWFQM